MPSRVRQQRTGTTNTEGYLSESSGTVRQRPGRQTTRQSQAAPNVTEQAEDEGMTVSFTIPIKGIC